METGKILVMVMAVVVMASTGAWAMDGNGTEEDPFQITDVNDLQDMEDDLGAWYELANNIDASDTNDWNGGSGFDPVGSKSDPFEGHFDGQGYEISELYIKRENFPNIGLFGYTDPCSVIKNVGLIDVDITAWRFVGGLVGDSYGTISNCSSSGDIRAKAWITPSQTWESRWVGGLIGRNKGGTISNCHSAGKVSADSNLGGLAGRSIANSIVSNCYSTCDVIGVSQHCGGLIGRTIDSSVENSWASGPVSGSHTVGGLVGLVFYGSIISNCYSTGSVTVTGNERPIPSALCAGGLVGSNKAGTSELPGINMAITITNCYSTSSVSGITNVGGLVGINNGQCDISKIEHCYSTGSVSASGDDPNVGGLVGLQRNDSIVDSNSFWDTETSGQSESDGGTGKTTAQMQTESTFTDAGWDFVGESTNGTDDIWRMMDATAANYPRLAFASVQNVDQDSYYVTIHEAVADANEFDTIVAYEKEKEYSPFSFLGKAITVRSADPEDPCVVQDTIISGCTVSFGSGAGTNSILTGFTIEDCNNSSIFGGVYCQNSSPTIKNCIFKHNTMGIRSHYLSSVTSPLITNCKFYNNTEAIRCWKSTSTIKNNLIYENDYGIRLRGTDSSVITNNTIVYNINDGVGKISFGTPTPTITNCILWDNGDDLYSSFSATYSCIKDPCDAGGTGNITSDPCFADPCSNDYHLLSASLCIDAGDPCGVYTGQMDIDFEDRVIGDDVDMGADEYKAP
jgi:parallel beta-helix repeat protein